jgi:hypothetical protein
MGLRCSCSIGLRKTHLGHVAIAAAINVIQLMSFLRGEAPEQIRTSAFKRAMIREDLCTFKRTELRQFANESWRRKSPCDLSQS